MQINSLVWIYVVEKYFAIPFIMKNLRRLTAFMNKVMADAFIVHMYKSHDNISMAKVRSIKSCVSFYTTCKCYLLAV